MPLEKNIFPRRGVNHDRNDQQGTILKSLWPPQEKVYCMTCSTQYIVTIVSVAYTRKLNLMMFVSKIGECQASEVSMLCVRVSDTT